MGSQYKCAFLLQGGVLTLYDCLKTVDLFLQFGGPVISLFDVLDELGFRGRHVQEILKERKLEIRGGLRRKSE